jgi:integrase
MGRIYRPTRPLLDAAGHPIIGSDGKPRRVPRSKNWTIRVYDARGHAKDISTGSPLITVAKRILHDLESAKGKGEPIGAQIGRITFEDAATDIENDYKVNGRRSLAHVKRRIDKHLKPAFGGRRLSNITTADVRAFKVARLEAGASAGEVNRELAALKRMFTLAVQAGKLLHRPHIAMLKEAIPRTGFFEREQFEAVRVALPEHLRPLVTFAYITGWRWVSELLPLRIGQVDVSAGMVRLEAGTTKNDEPREFPFRGITELRDTITEQIASAERLSRETGRVVSHLFHEPNGSPVSEYHFREAWESACIKAGCPARIPHDFRRTAVRNLVRAGIPERVAMMMTGHKTRSVFERYNITGGSDLNDAAGKLEAFLTRKPAAESKPTARVRPFKRAAGGR